MRTPVLIVGLILVGFSVFYFLQSTGGTTGARIHIIEKWSTVEDPTFTREFLADGKVIDSRAGQSITRNWAIFTKDMPVDGVPYILEENALYLSIAVPNGDLAYFEIVHVDNDTLTIIDLATKGSRTFKAVQ